MSDTPIQLPPGLFCITTYGSITQETAHATLEARSFSESRGLNNVKYVMESATLVERARNAAARQCLRDGHQYLFFCDGDTVFPHDAILNMLKTAYVDCPNAGVVGGYVPLRGDIALPTIDSGTGTWESWYPGSGIVEVMRTGCAFLLVKRAVLEALEDPWFRVRVPKRPIDALLEVDNFARIKFDGRNPFAGEAWDRLIKCAKDDPSIAPENFTPVEVGEDSGFCDRAKAAGFTIVVNTDIACGHVDRRVLTGADHRKAMDERDRTQRLYAGVTA
jgi:hypothetical protein